MNPQSVKCLMHSQQLPHVSRGAGALIKGCFAPVLVVKGRLHKALPVSYAMIETLSTTSLAIANDDLFSRYFRSGTFSENWRD